MHRREPRRQLEDRHLELAGGERLRFAWAAPEPSSGERLPPLVLGLHYGWRRTMPPRHGRDFLRVFLEPTFAGSGAAIAAPYCPERSWDHPRSVAAVLGLLDDLLERETVDPEHVVLAGYSLGGMGAWYLGARYPERFAAGMAVAAAPVVQRAPDHEGSGLAAFLAQVERGEVPWHEGLARFPLHVVHSRDDELIPFAPVERAVQALRARGAAVRFYPLEGVGHYDSRRYVEALRPVVQQLLSGWRR